MAKDIEDRRMGRIRLALVLGRDMVALLMLLAIVLPCNAV